MPRLPRLHVPGGVYHVILRGNRREDLFDTIADRHQLNEFVAEAIDKYGARIHGFCWMTNHLHAIPQVGDVPLAKVMQRIEVNYARYRNKKLGVRGHQFERRYKALLVDTDRY